MLKRFAVVLLIALFLSFTAPAYASGDALIEGMAAKAWRGLVNTFTGWVEFPAQIIKGYNEGFMGDEDQKIVGVVVGVFDGFGHSAGRTFSGMTELFTFWAASPESNEGVGIPLDAEYAWEEGVPYDAFDPNLAEGLVMPMGRKFLRGASNALLGVVEVPGQVLKGISEGAPDLGIVKGVWYWFSRGANGFTDIMTCILPNPGEPRGMAFDEEYPWDALVESMQ